ncbi:hypothetical protein GIX45_24355 [Erwinia sp. CPCC 100877]|nr:hypothetical protein [Erwinia sp. CPCC 100877]
MEIMELLYQFYLSKKEVKKLRLLKRILIKKEIPIQNLCNLINMSPYQTKALIDEIREELKQLQSSGHFIIYLENNIVYIPEYYDQEECLKIFIKLRQKYFDNSSYYQVLIYLFEKRSVTMTNLSEQLMFSVSYCYKLLDHLNGMFAKKNLPISIIKNINSIDLVGEEAYIRMYHYSTRLLSSNIYVEADIRYAMGFIDKDYEGLKTTKVKHDLIFHIMENAILRGYSLQELDSLDKKLLDCLIKFNNKPVFKIFARNNQTASNSEMLYYYFWTTLLIPESISEDERTGLAKMFSQIEAENLIVFSKNILKKLMKNYDISRENEHLIFFELIINSWSYDRFHLDKFILEDDLRSSNQRVREIELLLKDTKNQLEKPCPFKNESLYFRKIAQIIASYIPLDEAVYINISTLNHAEYITVVKNTLKKIFNPKSIQFTNNLNKADILVSDGLLNHSESQKFVYLGNIHNSEDWDNLNSTIQGMLLNKAI